MDYTKRISHHGKYSGYGVPKKVAELACRTLPLGLHPQRDILVSESEASGNTWVDVVILFSECIKNAMAIQAVETVSTSINSIIHTKRLLKICGRRTRTDGNYCCFSNPNYGVCYASN